MRSHGRTSLFAKRDPPWVVAHRGEAFLAPENTMAAFCLGRDDGADAIEIDVQLTREGIPVVIHDTYLDRTTSGTGTVRSRSWRELQTLDVAPVDPLSPTERIPLLEEVLSWAAETEMPLLVETKTSPILEDDVVASLERVLDPSRDRNIFVYSSDHDVIAQLSQRLQWLLLGVILNERGPSPRECLRQTGSMLLSQSMEVLTPDVVKEVHEMGGVVSSGVRHRDDIDVLTSWGVDLLVTNQVTVESLREAVDLHRGSGGLAVC